MIEILKDVGRSKRMLYVTKDEQEIIKKARAKLKAPCGLYFDRKGKRIAYHWVARDEKMQEVMRHGEVTTG